jgi:hypothetical protein
MVNPPVKEFVPVTLAFVRERREQELNRPEHPRGGRPLENLPQSGRAGLKSPFPLYSSEEGFSDRH